MSSIGSTLHSINASLLSEIQSLSPTAATGTGAVAAPTAPAKSDRIDFSQAGELFKQLQQLQSSNPAGFKQVLTDAVSKLTDAAGQATDPKQAAFLKDLAARFQKAADTGDLSALHPQSSSGATGQVHGHHHHGHKPVGNDGDADDQGASSTSATTATTAASATDPASQAAPNLLTLLSSSAGNSNGAPQDLFSLLASSGSTNAPSTDNSQIQNLLASFVSSQA